MLRSGNLDAKDVHFNTVGLWSEEYLNFRHHHHTVGLYVGLSHQPVAGHVHTSLLAFDVRSSSDFFF